MTFQRRLTRIDRIFSELQHALNTTAGNTPAQRDNPAADGRDLEMSPEQIGHSAGLMRINHTGEVCAQALYLGQARGCQERRNPQPSAACRAAKRPIIWHGASSA